MTLEDFKMTENLNVHEQIYTIDLGLRNVKKSRNVSEVEHLKILEIVS